MATGVIVWSETAASNATADSAVNWAEAMAPSAVNDSARAAMASVAKWRDDLNATLLASGVSTALTLTTNQVQGALTAGYEATFCTTFNIGTPATIAVDGLAAKPLRRLPNVELLADQHKAGQPVRMSYFTSNSGEWLTQSHKAPAVKVNVITTTLTTYTPTSGMAYAILECVGGGGAGGSILASAGGQSAGGGGGGGGTYSRKIVSATSITSSQVVTVGAGGTASAGSSGGDGVTSSVGSLCTASGGLGGKKNSDSASVDVLGGGPGAAGTGDFSIPGGWGGIGGITGNANGMGGFGGASGLGFGSGQAITLSTVSGAVAGTTGQNYGSGGSGAAITLSTATALGGNGAQGIVVITELV